MMPCVSLVFFLLAQASWAVKEAEKDAPHQTYYGSSNSATQWIAMTPSRPVVRAVISHHDFGTYEMTSETSADLSFLEILEGSKLTLTCQAGYPVFWYYGDQSIKNLPPQSRKCNPSLDKDLRYCEKPKSANESSSSGGGIPVIETYETRVIFENFSKFNAGQIFDFKQKKFVKVALQAFICKASRFQGSESFDVKIQLDLRQVPDTPFAEFVQIGFNRMWIFADALDDPNAKFSIPLIYRIPNDTAKYEYSFEQPDGTGGCSTLIPPTISQPIQIGHNLFEVTVDLTIGNSNECDEIYDFILQSTLKNGTNRMAWSNYWIRKIGGESRKANKLTAFDGSIELNEDTFYELRLYGSCIDPVTRMAVERIRLNTTTNACVSESIRPDRYIDECGIRSAAKFTYNIHNTGVRLFVRSTSSCVVILSLECPVDSLAPSFPTSSTNDTDEESAKLGDYSQDYINPWTVFKLSMISFSSQIYGYGFQWPGAKLDAIPNQSPTPGKLNEAFTNETLRLKCLMPLCHGSWIGWSKSGTLSWPLLGNKIAGRLPSFLPGKKDTQIDVAIHDNKTMSYELIVPEIGSFDSGLYTCGLFGRSLRQSSMIKPVTANVWISVVDPKPPMYDGPATSYVYIRDDGGTDLKCEPYGNPTPIVQWTYVLDGKNGMAPSTTLESPTITVHSAGTYTCDVSSRYGNATRQFVVNRVNNLGYIVAIPTVLVAVLLVLGAVWLWKRRAESRFFADLARELRETPEGSVELDNNVALNDQTHILPYNKSYEIDRNRITLMPRILGAGEFGRIVKGMLADGDYVRPVAVKMPKESTTHDNFRSLADELKIMSNIRPHVNVLRLVGACTANLNKEKRELLLLTEFCENGSLREYLIQNTLKFEGFNIKNGQFVGSPGAIETLLKYSYQVANGMAHLSACNVMHRDLALRNVLLTENHIVKISDFGMSRQHVGDAIYHKRFSPLVPIPLFWMAVESLAYQQYTKTSDVWSFGIVLWEIFSCGKRPYPTHCPDSIFRTWLMQDEKNRMGPPSICCEEIFDLMLLCWKVDPEARPTFSECKRIISRSLEQRSSSAYESMLIMITDEWNQLGQQNNNAAKPSDSLSVVNSNVSRDTSGGGSSAGGYPPDLEQQGVSNPCYTLAASISPPRSPNDVELPESRQRCESIEQRLIEESHLKPLPLISSNSRLSRTDLSSAAREKTPSPYGVVVENFDVCELKEMKKGDGAQTEAPYGSSMLVQG